MYVNKNQGKNSISHTPEGTDTSRGILAGGVQTAISKVHAASVVAIGLCTTPVKRGGPTRGSIAPKRFTVIPRMQLDGTGYKPL